MEFPIDDLHTLFVSMADKSIKIIRHDRYGDIRATLEYVKDTAEKLIAQGIEIAAKIMISDLG